MDAKGIIRDVPSGSPLGCLFDVAEHFSLTVPGPPIAQPRHKVGRGAGGYPRAYIPRNHAIHAYKRFVRLLARSRWGRAPLVVPLAATILFVCETEGGGRWKATLPDIDNLAKAVLDALQGIVFENDGLVARLELVKRCRFAWEKPRVEIAIRTLLDHERPPVRLNGDAS